MLTDIRGWDKDLCKRHRVIGQEVEGEIVLCVGIGIDDASHVDDESDRLEGDIVSAQGNNGSL